MLEKMDNLFRYGNNGHCSVIKDISTVFDFTE